MVERPPQPTILRRRRLSLVAAAICAVSVLAAPAWASDGAREVSAAAVEKRDPGLQPAAAVPGELLVRFRAGAAASQRRNLHASLRARVTDRIPAYDVDVVKLPRGASVASALRRYAQSADVDAVEPNYLRHRFETVPTDPFFDDLWGLRNVFQLHPVADWGSEVRGTNDADIDASDAWDVQRGNAATVIAVIDDGVDVAHPDLAGSLWANPDEVAANGLDDDGNGKIDDVRGWDVAENDASLLAPAGVPGGNAHGTHVAGSVAAQMNNGVGVAGVCPECRVMAVKVMDDEGRITLAALLRGIAYAKAEGAQIVNLSLGSASWSKLERAALAGAPFLAVVAAGNESLDNDMLLSVDLDDDGVADVGSPSYPASYTLGNVLSVAASNHRDEYGYGTGCFLGGKTRSACSFSSWGHDSVDVAAPGVDVTSTVPGNGYATWNGTSMAAPHVAGVAGLVKSQNPAYAAQAIKNAVMNGLDTPLTLKTLTSPYLPIAQSGMFTRTSGRVNANTALAASTANATPRTDGNVDGAKAMGTSSVKGAVRWPDDVNDVWKRKLYKGVKYRVILDGPATKDFDLLVWKPGTKEIWQLEPACWSGGSACRLLRYAATLDADETATFTAGATGVYYLHVEAWLVNAGAYTLRVRRV